MRGLRHILSFVAASLMLLLWGCSGKKNVDTATDTAQRNAESHPLPDTLRVATLYSPSSYFLFRDEEMGYDYSLVKQFASDKGMALDLTVAPSLAAMVELLDSGMVDLLAYEVPVTAKYRRRTVPCGPETFTHQVLVQPRKGGEGFITDETQLVGRDVYVEAHSKYLYRMQNLNEELGGGVNIHVIDRDTIMAEDLIEMVSEGEVPLTVVDSDIARVNKTYYPDLDISLPLSFPQRSQWAVARGRSWLADSVNGWLAQESPRKRNAELLKRYFELSKNTEPYVVNIDFSKGVISPYDAYFRRYASAYGQDWRMLAAQGYVESHFRNDLVSWAGARGIMQLMPVAMRGYGLTDATVTDPELNIEAAAKIMRDIDRSLSKYVSDPVERRKFSIAAYNSGIGHIYDAIALAGKHGKDPALWEGNVETALMWKSNPEYYTDPVCRNGYFRGRQTVEYVRKVLDFYARASARIPS